MTAYEPTPFNFALIPKHTPEQLLANVRYALRLDLPEVTQCAAHEHILSVAGGGPSLEDTWGELTGYVAAVNGTLRYLLDKGIRPQMCGVCDPSEHMVDVVDAVEGVAYFVASCVHPKVFDKLILANCRVYLWHLHPIDGLDALLNEHYPQGWLQIPGGCTMGTRWLTLGHHLGFRKFHLHGFDSSFRGKATHAYPDHQDKKEWITFDGYQTRINFLAQAEDFIGLMDDARNPDVDPIEVKLFGDGLLQSRYAHWLKKNPPFEWPDTDEQGRAYMMLERQQIPEFLKFIPKRGTCIQAGGNVGVYARRLAQDFQEVITFEPNPKNFNCLLKNTAGYQNIIKKRAALGWLRGHVATELVQEGHCGTYRVAPGKEAAVMPIDDLQINGCDLIWLDVEGYEERALQGAAKTVEKYKPAVIIEEKSVLAEMHGLKPDGAAKWLKGRQYYRVTKHGNDCLYVYGGP